MLVIGGRDMEARKARRRREVGHFCRFRGLHPKRTMPDLPAFRPLHSASLNVSLRSDGSETGKTGGQGFVRFPPGFSGAFNPSPSLAMSVRHPRRQAPRWTALRPLEALTHLSCRYALPSRSRTCRGVSHTSRTRHEVLHVYMDVGVPLQKMKFG